MTSFDQVLCSVDPANIHLKPSHAAEQEHRRVRALRDVSQDAFLELGAAQVVSRAALVDVDLGDHGAFDPG